MGREVRGWEAGCRRGVRRSCVGGGAGRGIRRRQRRRLGSVFGRGWIRRRMRRMALRKLVGRIGENGLLSR